jgi:hypothetical protein
MAPTIIQPVVDTVNHVPSKLKSSSPTALKTSGSLDSYKHFDSTPAIGTEFPDAQLADWISSPNADVLLRDLAITSTSILYDSDPKFRSAASFSSATRRDSPLPWRSFWDESWEN